MSLIDPAVADAVLRDALVPALAILPRHMDTDRARVMLMAIGGQESRLTARYQILDDSTKKGPARGLWQFERGSMSSRAGVTGIWAHSGTNELLRQVCRERDVSFDPSPIWSRLEHDDILAAACARLLLWTDPLPLPQLDDVEGAWRCYAERTWRPGKPHPETWAACHAAAVAAVLPPAAPASETPTISEDDL